MTTSTTAIEPPAGPLGHAAPPDEPARPWWRFPIVWMVVGGPLLVVVASFVSAGLAWHGADEVLVETPSARLLPVQPTAQTPAMTARNHAATAAPAP
jgi:hypothetical protein